MLLPDDDIAESYLASLTPRHRHALLMHAVLDADGSRDAAGAALQMLNNAADVSARLPADQLRTLAHAARRLGDLLNERAAVMAVLVLH